MTVTAAAPLERPTDTLTSILEHALEHALEQGLLPKTSNTKLVWQHAEGYLRQTGDAETAAILASLHHAGARIETYKGKPRIVWQHCELPMSHDVIKRDFLLPNWEAIATALDIATKATTVQLVADALLEAHPDTHVRVVCEHSPAQEQG